MTSRIEKWTSEELTILAENYPIMGTKGCITLLPSHTANSISYMAFKLGIKRIAGAEPPWTAEEDQLLRELFPKEGPACASRFPIRMKGKVLERARTLGLLGRKRHSENRASKTWTALKELQIATPPKPQQPGKRTRWSEAEDEIIRKHYLTIGSAGCAALLPRRTAESIRARAERIRCVRPHSTPKVWSDAEDQILRKYYPIEGAACVSRLPGRTEAAVKSRAWLSGLRAPSCWTPEEDAILREYYPAEGSACFVRLPNRSVSTAHGRVSQLGLHFDGANRRWTEEEKKILLEFYPKEGIRVLDRLPGRTRSAVASWVVRHNLKSETPKAKARRKT